MELDKALLLLASLFDRIEKNDAEGKWKLVGPISVQEREALRSILTHLGVELPAEQSDVPSKPVTAPAILPQISLDTHANSLHAAEDLDVILCLDFGTAMSKAFAIEAKDATPLDLAVGRRSGYTEAVYPVPSSIFISGTGRLFLGHEAIAQSLEDGTPGRERFDSPKQQLSQGNMTELSTLAVSGSINPTNTPLSKEELITLYLAYLTDLAGTELSEKHGLSRYVRRRFARPSWDKQRTDWADALLRRMLARAQILADTFHEKWSGGLDVRLVKAAFEQMTDMASPAFLIAEGIAEPVAAAASLVMSGEPQRRGFLVVDVGAGTTDIGLFVLTEGIGNGGPKVFQVPHSVSSPRMAGDTIDNFLRAMILKRHSVDLQSDYGRRIGSNLSLRIRQFKEILFRDKVLHYNLSDDTSGDVKLGDFLEMQEVKRFTLDLDKKLKETFDAIPEGYLKNLYAKQGVLVVLTGGGARLDMIQQLAVGAFESRGCKVYKEVAPQVPLWITDEYPQFADEYPRLAVAIGGASPNLPEMGPEFPDFGGGLGGPTYVPGNLPLKGR